MDELGKLITENQTIIASLGVAAITVAVFRRWKAGGRCLSKARLDGKTVIITGANTGIGKETAVDLANRGARVILACRDKSRGENALADVIKRTGSKQVVLKSLDLASLESVRKFAQDINKTESRIDILLNNAGVMMCPYMKTSDGFEMQFGTNHLGHFLLTNLLLEKIKRSAPARIINVSSLAHTFTTKIDYDKIKDEKSYGRIEAYAQSKLANILFSRELSRRLQAVTTDTGIDTRALGSSQNELSIIKLAFALTVPGMFILCLGVNFLCYKWGVKKGRSSYKKQAKSPGETQALDYHLYDDETPLSQLRSGPSGGPAVDPATHDYAAYDEIKEQRQRIAAGSERKKDGGYITPMAQDRPLPPVGSGDGNGYISPKTAQKQPQKGNAGKNGDSPSPPGNGGYLSPLEERKLSSNSDSGSDKSDKSRKYQNEPGKKSPKSKGVYESIKDAGITQEHQYIDLHTTVS